MLDIQIKDAKRYNAHVLLGYNEIRGKFTAKNDLKEISKSQEFREIKHEYWVGKSGEQIITKREL